MDNKDYYGKGGVLKKSANPKLINTAYLHDSSDSKELLDGLHIADLVHVLALLNAEAIPKKEAEELIKALIDITDEEIEIKPELGDVYNSKEYALKTKVGDVAGWLHMGRARREAINNGFLINYRCSVLKFNKVISNLGKVFSSLCMSHKATLMTDFTYMLHAQPTTLGHYLGTYFSPLTRDLERFDQYYDRLNVSWAGIGSVNGSRLKIDRAYLARLFGTPRASFHTRDSMWMPDIFSEGMFLLSSTLSNINRLVQELIVWNTHEFGYIDIDDSYARASVIMPQKKNPYPLAYMRGLCNEVAGKVSSYIMIGKEPSGFPDNRIFIYGDIIRTYQKAALAIDMFADFLQTIKWNKEHMVKSLENSYSFATDLAEEISITSGLDYKTGHKVVGKVIRLHRNGKTTSIIDLLKAELSQFWSNDFEKVITTIMDIKSLPQSRKAIGGASQKSLTSFVNNCLEKIDLFDQKTIQRSEKINNIALTLNKEIKKINDEFPIFKSSIKTK